MTVMLEYLKGEMLSWLETGSVELGGQGYSGQSPPVKGVQCTRRPSP